MVRRGFGSMMNQFIYNGGNKAKKTPPEDIIKRVIYTGSSC